MLAVGRLAHERAHLVAPRGQRLGDVAAEKAARARDQDLHRVTAAPFVSAFSNTRYVL